MKDQLQALHKKHPQLIREVRGIGLMIGIEFVTNELGYEFSKGKRDRRVQMSNFFQVSSEEESLYRVLLSMRKLSESSLLSPSSKKRSTKF